jgi:hypothetical protein
VLAKSLAAVFVLASVGYGVRKKLPLADATIVTFVTTLLFAPTVYPWYLLWFAALLPVSTLSLPVVFSLLLLCCTSLLSYEVLSHPDAWDVPPLILCLEYLLPLTAYLFLRRWRAVGVRRGARFREII